MENLPTDTSGNLTQTTFLKKCGSVHIHKTQGESKNRTITVI